MVGRWSVEGCGLFGRDGLIVVTLTPHLPVHPPLTAFAPPYAEAKGAWIPACAGMTGGGSRNDGGREQE